MNVIERHFAVLHKCTGNTLFTFKFISLAVLIAISTVALVANAQEPDPNERSTEVHENIEARHASATEARAERAEVREEKREAMASTSAARREAHQEKITERRGVLTARAQERIVMLAANISNRMEAVIRRFEQIIGRMERRIEKLETSGIDTTITTGHVNDAKDAIATAKVLLVNIDTVISDVTTSETPREEWQTAKSTYAGVREALKGAHGSLRAAVATLKAAVSEGNGTSVSDAAQNENGAVPTGTTTADETVE